MAEPITLLSLIVGAGGFIASEVASGEIQRFFRKWVEAATNPVTGLPRNEDLVRASRESLRSALQVLLTEQAGRLDPKKPWLAAMRQHLRAGKLGSVPLVEAREHPHWTWLEAAHAAVRGEAFDAFHDRLGLSDDEMRECLRAGGMGHALGQALADRLLEWLGSQITVGSQPPGFDCLVRDGWEITPGHNDRITLTHAYGLFFREHLKADPRVFNSFTTDTLNALQAQLDQQGVQLAGIQAPLEEWKPLREAVQKLVAQPPVFSQFEAWLTPQLGGLKDTLAGIQAQLAALARAQDDSMKERGETLVALTLLRVEAVRGNSQATTALAELTAHVTRLEHKLDHLMGGLPIQRFQQPDPPTHELQLLHAKHRTVPLLGRGPDLDALCAWVESSEPISARLLVGGAGTGKTRLALELLLRVGSALPGWQAGILGAENLRLLVKRTPTPDFNWPAPTLLVVDYAQTLADPLATLLRALTRLRQEGRPPLRLLLLERQPGDWFEALLRQEDNTMPVPVRSLFHPERPVPLTSLPPGDLRREVLQQTLTRAAQLTGKEAPALPPPGDPDYDASLARPLFDQPLNLMLAALAARELGLLAALRRERIHLAEALAERELRRIERFARNPDNAAQKRVLRHLAACATMQRGFTAEALDRAVAEELAALRLDWPDGPGDLVDCLKAALPGEHQPVAPVEPDFVGEALVLCELAREDKGADPWRAWSASVERCGRRDAWSTPATLLHAFQNFGHERTHGEALLTATDTLIRAGLAATEPALLLGLEGALPDQTVELRRRAAEVTRHLYDRLKAAMQQGRDHLRSEVARLANNLAVRWSELGRRVDALAPAQEAVELYRALAKAQPDAFTPDLAMSLNNLASFLSELGRRADALAPAQEAVELYRPLAKAQPDAFNPYLASSLSNLAAFLSELGRQADALAPAQEAVELYCPLAKAQPDAFNPNLAKLLGTMGQVQAANEDMPAALSCFRQGVEGLTPAFQHSPQAFAPLIQQLAADYLRVLATTRREPDLGAAEVFLVPVMEGLQRLAEYSPSGNKASD